MVVEFNFLLVLPGFISVIFVFDVHSQLNEYSDSTTPCRCKRLLFSGLASSGAHSASYSLGTACSFLRGTMAKQEAYHSRPSSANITKEWCYTVTPHLPS